MPDPVEEFLGSLEKPQENAPVDDFLRSLDRQAAPSSDEDPFEANKRRQLALDASLPYDTIPEPVADITIPSQEPLATATAEDKVKAGIIDVNSGAMSPISMANPVQLSEQENILRRVGAVGWDKSVFYPKQASDSFKKNILASTTTDKDGKPRVSSNANDYTVRSQLMERLQNATDPAEKDAIRKQLVARGLPETTVNWLEDPQGWYERKVSEVWSDKFPTAKTSADASKMQDQLDIAEAKYIFAKRNTGPKFAARGANVNGTAQMVPAADVAFPDGEKARAYLAKASEEDKKALDEVRTERLWMGALQSVIGGLTGNLTKGYSVNEKTQEQIDKAVAEAPTAVRFGIDTAGMAAAGLPMGAASKAFTLASKAGLVKAGLTAAAAEAKAAKLGHTLSMALYGGVSTPGGVDEKLKGALHLAAFGYTAGRLSQPMEAWFAKLPAAEKSKFVDYVGKAMSSGLAFAGADQIVNDLDPATALQAGLQGVIFGLAGGAKAAKKPGELVEAPKVETPKAPEASMVAFEAAQKAALNSGRTPEEAKVEAVKAAVEASKAMPAPEAVPAPEAAPVVERRKVPERPGSPRTLSVDKVNPGQDITVRATNGEIVEGKLAAKREDGTFVLDMENGSRVFTPAEVERIHPYVPREGAAKIPGKEEPVPTPIDPKDTDAVIAARIERLDMAADAGKSAISGLDDFESKLRTAKKLVETGVDRTLAVEALTATNVDASHPAHLSAVEAGALYDRAVKEAPKKAQSPELPNPLEGTRVGPRVVAEGGVEGNVVPGTLRTEGGKKVIDVVTDKGDRIPVSRESLARAPEPVKEVEAPAPDMTPEAKAFYDRTLKTHQEARAQLEDAMGRELTPSEMKVAQIMTPEQIRDAANERFSKTRKSKTGERGMILPMFELPFVEPMMNWIKERGKDAFRLGRATLEWFPGRGLENMRRESEAYEKRKGTLHKAAGMPKGQELWYHMSKDGTGGVRPLSSYEEAVRASSAKHAAKAEKDMLRERMSTEEPMPESAKNEPQPELSTDPIMIDETRARTEDLNNAKARIEDLLNTVDMPKAYIDLLERNGFEVVKSLTMDARRLRSQRSKGVKFSDPKSRAFDQTEYRIKIDEKKVDIVDRIIDLEADASIFRVIDAMAREGSVIKLPASAPENSPTPPEAKGWERMRQIVDEQREVPTVYLDKTGKNIPGETFWVKPELAKELQHLADLIPMERPSGVAGGLATASTWVQTKGIMDAVFHGTNIMAEAFKASGWKAPYQVFKTMFFRAGKLAYNPAERARVQAELAEVGGSRDMHEHFDRPGVASKVEKVLGRVGLSAAGDVVKPIAEALPGPAAKWVADKAKKLSETNINIEGLSNWALNHADLAVRELLLEKAKERIRKYNESHPDKPLTPIQELQIKRREVLQAGNYNKLTIDAVTKTLRNYQVQPFAVAAKTMTSNAWKISPPGIALAATEALATRAKTGRFDPAQVIELKRRLAGFTTAVGWTLATSAAVNLARGKDMFPDGIPIGAIWIGEKDGRPQYIDWHGRLMGYNQMTGYTGTRRAAADISGAGKTYGGDTLYGMAADILARAAHLGIGPWPDFLVGATGANTGPGFIAFNPSTESFMDAATEINSLVHAYHKADEKTAGEEGWEKVKNVLLKSAWETVKGPFSEKTGQSKRDADAAKMQMYKVFDQANRIIKKAKDADPEKREIIVEKSLKAYADSIADDPNRDRKMGLLNKEVRSRVARWESAGDRPSDGTVPLSQDPAEIVDGLVTAYGQVKPKDEAAWIKARMKELSKDMPAQDAKEVRVELLRRLQLPTDTLGKPSTDEVVERVVRDFFDLDPTLPLRERNQWLSEELQGYSMNPAFSQEELAAIRKNVISRIQAKRRR